MPAESGLRVPGDLEQTAAEVVWLCLGDKTFIKEGIKKNTTSKYVK